VAFRDLAGPTGAERWAAWHARAMRGRWRGASPWNDRPFGRRALDRRPSPPSRRLGRAHMPRATFQMLALGWISAIALLLITSLIIRGLG
jgi:hypothetical protein